jgi:chemotaxis protein methyltransferase CheR
VTIGPQAFSFVRELVRAESAIVLETGKEYLVESRLLPLARAAGHSDVDAYVADLSTRRTPAALKQVVEALTTNETSWFRDGDPFTTLRQTVLPTLAKARSDRSIRIWAAACSSGQEPYSLVMTALDTPELAGWKVDVLATDLSDEMLDRARKGEYSQLEVNRGLPATTMVRHFERAGPHWRISRSIRDLVEFRQLNLVRPFPPMGRFDVVFLRNVLIYFDLPTKRDVLQRVRQVMAPDGHLFLGAAEMTLGVDDAWERVPAGRSSVYRIREDLRLGRPACVPF